MSRRAAGGSDGSGDDPLLAVRDLRTHFHTAEGTVRAVDGVSFDVRAGETLCLVGESGSGKTVTCESVGRLVESPPGELVGGEVVFDGRDLTEASESELRAVRGDRVSYVFQNPQGALDPVYTVGEQLEEVLGYHRDLSEAAARERAVDLLDRVGLPDAPARANDYPHEFSGGMRQRVVVAMALANDPDLLVADEPTTALDVTTQAQLLDLIADLQAERGMAVLFVTHDLGVVAGIADRVVVMYGGRVMERGTVYDVFERPAHPYTRALLGCLPGRGGGMDPIGGEPPDPADPPDGCRFHPRCPHAVGACRAGDQPPLYGATVGGEASCVFYDGDRDPTVLDDPTDGEGSEDGDGNGNGSGEGTGGRGGSASGAGGTGDGRTGPTGGADR
ncbi:ABC transporter ATP-binding protein [Candidatus Halobonum tyrrellensis]|uniref:Nickel import system ATP-binding protein NikD n=1 Tax=Candidatus Halobonum tyrrellensis G22 TaxID=1324957 RepID=V4HEL2_9EURY|nr:ABC transporter ATP-binding protein [Candidatus Halobonum tyrrellensis]ESP89150.1 dipeptide/oligopeptide/nickel ABC transporter ATP-binding protein [Candidatus Halobonum tyrrellensis G22]